MRLALENVRFPLASFDLRVNCQIAREVTGLFGSSGAGKTTILELIAGLRRPSSGVIRLDDEAFADGDKFVPAHLRKIGYVTQDDTLFPHLSVAGNLRYGVRDGPENRGEEEWQRVVELLELEGLLRRRVASLSGGERRRVALGRALLSAPRLLLLDEPLSGLDPSFRMRILEHLSQIRQQFAIPIIYVTHYVDEVLELCDEMLLIQRGEIVRQGSPSELLAG